MKRSWIGILLLAIPLGADFPRDTVNLSPGNLTLPRGGVLYDFAVSDTRYVYVGTNTTVDIFSLPTLTRVDTLNHCGHHVNLFQQFLYVACFTTMDIYNVTQPTQPVYQSSVSLPGNTERILVIGHRMYLSFNDASLGIRVYDLSQPTAPTEIAQYAIPYRFFAVDTLNQIIFALEENLYGGVHVYDVSSGSAVHIGFFAFPNPVDLLLDGSVLFVAGDAPSRTYALDVQQPGHPVPVDSFPASGNLGFAPGSPSYVMILQDNNIHILRWEAPSTLQQIAFWRWRSTIGNSGRRINGWTAGWGGRVIFASMAGGYTPTLGTATFRDQPAYGQQITAIAHLSTAGMNGWATRVDFVDSTTLSVAAWKSGVFRIRISDPLHPTVTARIQHTYSYYGYPATAASVHWDCVAYGEVGVTSCTYQYRTFFARGVFRGNPYGYFTNSSNNTLNVVQAGSLVTQCSLPGQLYDLYAIENGWGSATLYVAAGDSGLRIARLQPGYPSPSLQVLGAYVPPGKTYDVKVVDSLAYLASGTAGLRIVDVHNPAQPVEIGAYDTPGQAYGVAVQGPYAFVADGDSGLRVVDIQNPAQPVEVAHWVAPGVATGVAVDQEHVYLAHGINGLWVLRLDLTVRTDSLNLATEGFVPSPQSAFRRALDVAVDTARGYAYLAEGEDGLAVIQLANPQQPAVVAWLPPDSLGGNAYRVALQGNRLMVLSGTMGMQILDLTLPDRPQRGGTYRWGYALPYDVAPGWDSLAFVAYGDSGLLILSLTSLQEVGRFQPGGSVQGVEVDSPYAYLAVKGIGVFAVDLSQPQTPIQRARFEWADVQDLALRWPLAYLSGPDRTAFPVIRVGDLTYMDTATSSLGTLHFPAEVHHLLPTERYLLVAEGPRGLRVLDQGEVAYYDSPGYALRSRFVGGRIYLADHTQGLRILIPGWRKDSLYMHGEDRLYTTFRERLLNSVASNGTYAYIYSRTARRLLVYDIQDPTRILRVGESDTLPVGGDGILRRMDTLLVLAPSGSPLSVYSLQHPLHPVQIGTSSASLSIVFSFALQGSLGYVGESNDLRIFDLSTPTQPVQRSSFPTSAVVRGLAPKGSLLFLAANDSGLRILNVQDPTQPIPVGSFLRNAPDTLRYMQDVAVRGTHAFLLSSTRVGAASPYRWITELLVLDVSQPANPLLLTRKVDTIQGNHLTLDGRYLFVWNSEWTTADAGWVHVYDVSLPSAPTLVAWYHVPGPILNDLALPLGYTGPILTVSGSGLNDGVGNVSVLRLEYALPTREHRPVLRPFRGRVVGIVDPLGRRIWNGKGPMPRLRRGVYFFLYRAPGAASGPPRVKKRLILRP